MTTRTPAEIEAGAKEYVWPSRLFSAEEQDVLWLKISESDRRHYLDRFRDVLSAADAAADAVAAPAVGVSDDRNPIDILFEFGSVYHRWIKRVVTADDINAATRHALERLGATETLVSLTAQPEPGTHDDAGQATEGGVTG